ncbi:MAG: ComE operon protein 1 [uncultured bacterium]|nr:MAG: ComE operon protein 1 [uncultured bacterium]
MINLVTGTKWNIFEKLTLPDRLLIGFLAVGLLISGISLFRGILGGSRATVEYIDSSNQTTNVGDGLKVKKVVIDVEGAVMSPGVYELPAGSRIKDLLVTAGGYSEKADRGYCEKNLNLAQELKDGQKIYIPFITNTPTSAGYAEAKTESDMVNLNTASLKELDTLWGVGPARAETIVKNRPYGSLDEVVSKGGMTKQIFDKNAGQLVVY